MRTVIKKLLGRFLYSLRIRHLRRSYEKNRIRIHKYACINLDTRLGCGVCLGPGDYSSSTIGRGSYAVGAQLSNCSIGQFCSIAKGVSVISFSHPTSFVSTWPGFFRTSNHDFEHLNDNLIFDEHITCENGFDVVIGNDVWIGQDATLMGGVVIGDGAIVGAHALVTKNIPPFAVVGGVPARIIRFRFSQEDISFLEEIKWWDWPMDQIERFAFAFDSVSHLRDILRNKQDSFEETSQGQ